jgi:type II secretory ATPase GspE/PulE/Tfp pilus assembly ATPase PilB-like protein
MSYAQYNHDIIKLVDVLLSEAIERAVSDIHLEPFEYGLRVRFRIDGLLHDQEIIGQTYMSQVCSRIQVLANIDGSQHRMPHDGAFSVAHNNSFVDIRVSAFPALHGPKMVLRILDRDKNSIVLGQLGMQDELLNVFKGLIEKSSGFILVSGPTGSGKTTTLYASLAALNLPHKHIITLEDPVEYHVAGITQGHIYPAAGFTFEKGIRALLRHDPDVVMVGEIRDTQTAHIALQAAITGHLVFSTVHTNDAVSVVVRLIDMGIESFLITTALTGIIAQRLVRKICTHCKQQSKQSENDKALLAMLYAKYKKNIDHSKIEYSVLPDCVFKGSGCKECNFTGYRGRTGIFELLEFSSAIRLHISNRPNIDDLYAQAMVDGMKIMLADGLDKVSAGIITLDELVRVLS